MRAPKGRDVLAAIALAVALGGTSYAAATVSGGQVRDATLGGADVRDGRLGGADVRDGSLRRRDLAAALLPRSAEGAPGAAGAPGPAGEVGPAGARGEPGDAGAAGAPSFVAAADARVGTTSLLLPQEPDKVLGGKVTVAQPATLVVRASLELFAGRGIDQAACAAFVGTSLAGRPVDATIPNGSPDGFTTLAVSGGVPVEAGTHDFGVACAREAGSPRLRRGSAFVLATPAPRRAGDAPRTDGER
jgi:hypothetical protein